MVQAFVYTDVVASGLLCAGQQIELQVTQDAKDHLVKLGFDADYGARPAKRTIQNMVRKSICHQRPMSSNRRTKRPPKRSRKPFTVEDYSGAERLRVGKRARSARVELVAPTAAGS